jgi:hypothetical protein
MKIGEILRNLDYSCPEETNLELCGNIEEAILGAIDLDRSRKQANEFSLYHIIIHIKCLFSYKDGLMYAISGITKDSGDFFYFVCGN